MFTNDYEAITKRKNNLLDAISQIAKAFPISLQRKALNKMRTMLLQDGNTKAIKEKLKSFEFVTPDIIERLDESEGLEL